MNIELAKKEELKEINKIAKQVHDLHVKWRPDIFKEVDEPISEEMFQEMLLLQEIYVAKEEGKIVAYANIKIKEANNMPGYDYRKILNLEAIGVDEQYRNKGIGTQLIEYIINIGKQQGCTDFVLTVNEENVNAIKCYEKIGMRVRNIKYSMKI